MARTHLTLAALATAAVPGLDVQATRPHTGGGHGEYDSAVLVDRSDRQVIMRRPRTQLAESEQAADLVALRALTTGVRSRLPFDVPVYLGQAPSGGTRALAYEYLPGTPLDVARFGSDLGLAAAAGRAIAAIHALPTSVASDAGLPQNSALEVRSATVALIGRTADTGHLPAALLHRWEEATDNDGIWQFLPALVNGSLGAASFLIGEDGPTAVIGWSGLRVDDPARDLHWMLAASADAAQTGIAAYTAARGAAADHFLGQRAMLYAELEIARWLLHGVETRNPAIVDDAVGMLDALVESVHGDLMNPISPATGPVLAVADVEALLGSTPYTEARRDAGAELHTDTYDQSSFERGAYGDETEAEAEAEDEPVWADEPQPARPHQDETPTGPIELFSLDDEPDDADASATLDQSSRSSSSS